MRTIIDQSLVNQAQSLLAELKSYGVVANRLKAIIASSKHPIKTVAEIFDIDPTGIHRWASRLKKDGIAGLNNAPKHLDGILIKNKHKQQIKKWLSINPNITIKQVRIKLKEQFNLDISKSTVHNSMKSAGFSHITARSVHYKQDKEKLEEFKKNSNQNKRKQSS